LSCQKCVKLTDLPLKSNKLSKWLIKKSVDKQTYSMPINFQRTKFLMIGHIKVLVKNFNDGRIIQCIRIKPINFTWYIPYKNKYWQGTKFGESANHHAMAKFKSRQYFSIVYQLWAYSCFWMISPN